ncbi:MAG TPA: hypothetical protein VH419_11680 [Nocardioidaceae bacterium]
MHSKSTRAVGRFGGYVRRFGQGIRDVLFAPDVEPNLPRLSDYPLRRTPSGSSGTGYR